jgi:multiple sugar transport system permease protein
MRRLLRREERARLRRASVPYLFVLPAGVYLAGLLAYPIVLTVLMSFQDVQAGDIVTGGAPWAGARNYQDALGDPLFVTAAWHSLFYCGVSVGAQLTLGLALALFYSRRFPGAVAMRSLYLIAYAIPVVVTAEIWRWLLDGRSGFVDWILSVTHLHGGPVYWLADPGLALPAVTAVQIWLGVPFTMVTLLSGLMAIPRELHEAAAIDGAGAWNRFRHVTWPLLRPTLLASGLLSLIFTFKSFDLVWIASQGGPAGASDVLPTLAYKLVFLQFLFGKGAAVLNVIFAVLLVLSVLYLLVLRREERLA